MPVLKSRTAIQAARDLTAFLNLELGLIRRPSVPNYERMFERARSQLGDRDQRLSQAHEQLEEKGRQLSQSREQLAEKDRRISQSHGQLNAWCELRVKI